MTYIRHSGAWHRHTVAIPGIDRFSVDVETADLTASFTVEILRDPEGERSRLCIDDADLAVLTAVPAFFAAYTAAAKARGAGMSSDAVEILLLREGALDTTPRTKPTSA